MCIDFELKDIEMPKFRMDLPSVFIVFLFIFFFFQIRAHLSHVNVQNIYIYIYHIKDLQVRQNTIQVLIGALQCSQILLKAKLKLTGKFPVTSSVMRAYTTLLLNSLYSRMARPYFGFCGKI